MFAKGSKMASMIKGTCPKCQEESMYEVSNPYDLSKTLKMHSECSHCHLHYAIEPSFFYGAMYVSYGLGVALAVASFIIAKVFMNASLKVSFIAIIVSLIVLMPVIMRLSRNIWINIFVKYDKDWKNKK